MAVNGTVKLRDLRPISQEEYRAAVRIFGTVRELIERRPSEIARRGNAAVGYPDKNWKPEGNPSDFFRFTAHLLQETPSYDVINRLRFFTGGFTGMPLLGREWTYERYLSTYRQYTTNDYDAWLEQTALPDMRFSLNEFRTAIRDLPEELIIGPPRMLGEVGWEVGDTVVNFDTYSYQERMVLLHESGALNWLRQRERTHGPLTFLEIGGGYGALALHLKRLFPTARYLFVDLPESLLFSATYLGLVSPEVRQELYTGADPEILRTHTDGYAFIANHLFEDVVEAGLPVDLAINTLSFHEMSPAQVHQYAVGLKRLLGTDGVLFEQNGANGVLLEQRGPIERESALGCNPEPILAEMLCGERIRPLLVRPLRGIPRLWSATRRAEILERRFKPFANRRTFAYQRIAARRWLEERLGQWRASRWLTPLRQLKRALEPLA